MADKLILRSQNSNFPSPFQDTTLGSVLSHADLDNNQIYLKSNIIYGSTVNGTLLSLNKIGGATVDVELSGLTGGGSPAYDEYISVTASTPDNYIGVSNSGITSYSPSVIYLMTFNSTNNTTATTINIDGVGAVNLYVPTENGLEGPVESGITTGITYFMTYNGDSMQLFDTNPQTTPLLYTNPAPVPVTIGGIAVGSTFSGATMQQMWDSLLYPYLSPAFSSFSIAGQPTTLEVGATISAGSKTFNWGTTYSGNISPNTIKIKNFNTGAIISTPSTGIANDGSEVISIASVTRTTPGYQRWIVYATTVATVTISKIFDVNWYNRIYYGTSSATTLTANQITGLTGTVLTATSYRTHVFGSGDYKYICIPTAFANPTLFKDASTNLTVAMAGPAEGYSTLNNGYYVNQVVVTNAFGINVTYDVYRTKNILGSEISIVTS